MICTPPLTNPGRLFHQMRQCSALPASTTTAVRLAFPMRLACHTTMSFPRQDLHQRQGSFSRGQICSPERRVWVFAFRTNHQTHATSTAVVRRPSPWSPLPVRLHLDTL